MRNRCTRPRFDSAINTYDDHALIQQEVAGLIIERLNRYQYISKQQINILLDLGSGLSTLDKINFYAQQNIAYDLSLAMLQANKGHNQHRINGDAHQLPFMTESIDVVVSNLMLQWAYSKQLVMNEIARVLTKSGKAIISILIKPSMWQLYHALQQIDVNISTLSFINENEYQQLVIASGLKIVNCYNAAKMVYFSDIYALLWHFKLTGTSIFQENQVYDDIGLAWRRVIKQLNDAYAKFKTRQGLALNYSYCLLEVSK